MRKVAQHIVTKNINKTIIILLQTKYDVSKIIIMKTKVKLK